MLGAVPARCDPVYHLAGHASLVERRLPACTNPKRRLREAIPQQRAQAVVGTEDGMSSARMLVFHVVDDPAVLVPQSVSGVWTFRIGTSPFPVWSAEAGCEGQGPAVRAREGPASPIVPRHRA